MERRRLDDNAQILLRYESGARVTRIPSGHPEAFATLYSEAAMAIRAHRAGAAPPPDVQFLTVVDGVCGLTFIEAAVRSSRSGGRGTVRPSV